MTAILQFPRPEQASARESSKALKAALRQAFPHTRFSVRMDRGTAYGCVSVQWTDGPTTKRGDAVILPFIGEGFDGSTDSSYGVEGTLPDGRRTGLRLIHSSRSFSVAFLRRVVEAVGRQHNAPRDTWPSIIDGHGGAWLGPEGNRESPLAGDTWERHWTWESLVWRAAEDRTEVAR